MVGNGPRNTTEVRVTGDAQHHDASHAVTGIFPGSERISGKRLPVARPDAAGIKSVVEMKQGGVMAGDIPVEARSAPVVSHQVIPVAGYVAVWHARVVF